MFNDVLGYEIIGHGSENVIILHGWLSNSETWNPIKPYLNETDFTYIFANIRGYLTSSSIKGEYTADEIAQDVLNLADHLNIEKFHVLGHSMTGMGVQKLAVLSTQNEDKRIKSVICVTPVTATGLPIDEDGLKFLQSVPHNREATEQVFMGSTGSRYSSGWAKYKATQQLKTAPKKDVMLAYLKMFSGSGFVDLAKKVKSAIPVLVIAGRHDMKGMQASYCKSVMPDMFPNSQIKIIEGAGHYPMNETPIELVTMMEEFLQGNDRVLDNSKDNSK